MSLALRGVAAITARLTGAGGLQPPVAPIDIARVLDWADGDALDKANDIFEFSGALAPGGRTFQFITVGGLRNPHSDVINWARIKGLYIRNTHATEQIDIGGGNPIAQVGTVLPGGVHLHLEPSAAAFPTDAGDDTITLTVTGAGSVEMLVIGAFSS